MTEATITALHATITALHATFCALTGLPIRMHMRHERAWAEWCHEGFTIEDLKLVIRHLQGCVRRKERHPGCLRFGNLVDRPDVFEDERAEAIAWGRKNGMLAKTPRKTVLAQSGRPQVVRGHTRTAGEVVARLQSDPVAAERAFREFQALKGRL